MSLLISDNQDGIDRTMAEPEISQTTPVRRIGPFTVRRWVVIVFFAVITLFMMQEVLDPYGDKGYMEINHGDHKHYVPPDRDPNVSISNFPQTPPGPNERIMPDGRVVPK